jgi:hypothetical protein
MYNHHASQQALQQPSPLPVMQQQQQQRLQAPAAAMEVQPLVDPAGQQIQSQHVSDVHMYENREGLVGSLGFGATSPTFDFSTVADLTAESNPLDDLVLGNNGDDPFGI